MSLEIGIVGLPNVGKSTLFNALTNAGAEVASYPFTTIDPNVGVVPLQDARLDYVAGLVHPQKTVPSTVRFVDIAGLVRGAHLGEGLGNQFLGHIRNVDAIAMVVRCFEDENVAHIDPSFGQSPAARLCRRAGMVGSAPQPPGCWEQGPFAAQDGDRARVAAQCGTADGQALSLHRERR